METKLAAGEVVQIVGPVIDAQFPADSVPDILSALTIDREDGSKLVLEVQQHLGENRVRTIAMDATDGLQRGTKVNNTGKAISMPIGDDILGRLFNVVGESHRRYSAAKSHRASAYSRRASCVRRPLDVCRDARNRY